MKSEKEMFEYIKSLDKEFIDKLDYLRDCFEQRSTMTQDTQSNSLSDFVGLIKTLRHRL